eukprot:PhF_6_TR22531/c0_g1_i1/m.31993
MRPHIKLNVGLAPPTYHPDTWQPNHHAPHCPICGCGFCMLRRKHHCRRCGRVVCGSCSQGAGMKKSCQWCLSLGIRAPWDFEGSSTPRGNGLSSSLWLLSICSPSPLYHEYVPPAAHRSHNGKGNRSRHDSPPSSMKVMDTSGLSSSRTTPRSNKHANNGQGRQSGLRTSPMSAYGSLDHVDEAVNAEESDDNGGGVVSAFMYDTDVVGWMSAQQHL